MPPARGGGATHRRRRRRARARPDRAGRAGRARRRGRRAAAAARRGAGARTRTRRRRGGARTAEMGARGRAAGLALVVGRRGPARARRPGAQRGRGRQRRARPRRRAAGPPADPGRALFVRMGCGSCHMLAAGAGIGQVGPDLDALLPSYDAASLRAKIVDPYPAGAPAGFLAMPEDFGRRMNARRGRRARRLPARHGAPVMAP